MAHTNAVRFYNELERRSVGRFSTVSNTAFLVSAVLFASVMIAGYSTFGKASQVRPHFFTALDFTRVLGNPRLVLPILLFSRASC